MSKYFISVNQLAEFSDATTSAKGRILKQQKAPDKLLIPWYQRAKGAIKKFFSNVKDYSPIEKAIRVLEEKHPITDRQRIDKKVSIEALELIRKINLPKLLMYIDYEIIVPETKKTVVDGVDIIVAPEILIKAKYRNEIVYGAIKIHISKGKPFNSNQCSYVAALIYRYLTKEVAKTNEKVLPELCLCLDVFAERLVAASPNPNRELSDVKIFCKEIRDLWSLS
jgi:hypothetical protein